ncbi:ABC transporter permease subunit [Candidatus Izimaplasma bacterium]|nr:ABC transporter permease subunit [Candidatus Izimaplasma bacterium]
MKFTEKIKIFHHKIITFLDRVIPRPKKITLANDTIVQPPRSASILLSIVLLFAILYFTDTVTTLPRIGKAFENFFVRGSWMDFVSRIFTPEWSYYGAVIPKVLETLRMAILGTFVGAVLALPTAYFISSNLHKNSRFGQFFINIAKALLSVLRTFPMLVYAQLILLLFKSGSGPIVGTIAITLFTYSILTKMLYEYIETLEIGAFEAIEGTGVTKSKAFTTAVVPDILSVYYSYALYCFDINVRHSVILGYVGAGGIGVILQARLQGNQYEEAGLIIVGLFVTILTIEAVSKAIRRRLA